MPRERRRREKTGRSWTGFWLGSAIVVLIGAVVIPLYFWNAWIVNGNLPDVNTIGAGKPNVTTKILDRNGVEIGEIFVERRTILNPDQIPVVMIQAVLAAEDAHFEEHAGLDYLAIIKTALTNLVSRHRARGASTITQQVVKVYVGKERSLRRKVQEAYLAVQLEKRWSKRQILTFYLNQIYFGQRRYGVEEAARYYFDKPVAEVNLAEAALLASLPKAPERYPKNTSTWKERQKYVLYQMVRYGWATQADADLAANTTITLARATPGSNLAPEFVDEVERQLKEQYGDDLGRLGITVKTTCDIELQKMARTEFEEGLRSIDSRNGKRGRPQGALVLIDPHTREVLAMVGGYEQRRGDFNRATAAKRQAGSTFKTIVWAAAFAADDLPEPITPATFFQDIEKTYEIPGSKPWTPMNHAPSTGEEVSMRYAIAHSLNTVSAQVTEAIGPNAVVSMAKQLGIKTELRRNLGPKGAPIAPLSIALGTSEVTPLELTNAYAVFANRGRLADPTFVLEVNGQARPKPTFTEAISPALAFLVTSNLQSVIFEGTGIRAKGKFDQAMAGKTGTTQSSTDAWFIGYTPHLIAGVWVGFDEDEHLGSWWEGSRAALPIWINVMKAAHQNYPDTKNFGEPPSGIVMQDGEYFLEDKVPLPDPLLNSTENGGLTEEPVVN